MCGDEQFAACAAHLIAISSEMQCKPASSLVDWTGLRVCEKRAKKVGEEKDEWFLLCAEPSSSSSFSNCQFF